MNALPPSVVVVLELAERRVRKKDIPADEATQAALRVCRTKRYVGFAKLFGPEPPRPQRYTKPARDLKIGDMLAIGDQGHLILRLGPPPRGSIPSGGGLIQVEAEGCMARIYEPAVRVPVLDGPIPMRPSWEELVLSGDGQLALDEFRLTIAHHEMQLQPTAQSLAVVSLLPSEGTTYDKPEDVPASFRDGGKPDGELLTVKHLETNSNWFLKGPYITRHYGPSEIVTTHVRIGKQYVYLYTEMLALRDRKTKNDKN